MERALIIFEDEDLLVVNKPAGMNTHAPSPFAGEGLYEWLKNREARWSRLAIIHRLDKETSGVMVFGKTAAANRSLTKQFTEHTVRKRYVLWTDRVVKFETRTVVSALVRVGEKYASKALHAGAERAETRFRVIEKMARREARPTRDAERKGKHRTSNIEHRTRNFRDCPLTPGGGEGVSALQPEAQRAGMWIIEAEPVTGRTHQIRAQAAAEGFPILGDVLYGGTAAKRVFLHAAELRLRHPVTSEEMTFGVEADFEGDARVELRERLLSAECGVRSAELGNEEGRGDARPTNEAQRRKGGEDRTSNIEHSTLNIEIAKTNSYRVVHGAADGWAGWYVERLGEFLLSQSERALGEGQQDELKRLMEFYGARGVYHKILTRQVRRTDMAQASPQLVLGEAAAGPFTILENGVRFELSFNEGYSVGLFLDQRENRRRFLRNYVGADFGLIAPALGSSTHAVPDAPSPRPSPPVGEREKIEQAEPTGNSKHAVREPARDFEMLNTFAYTCGFSVCAAMAGARTTSLDLSKKYLEWGKRNFALNGIDAAAHDFIFGDAFGWMRRLTKKGRAFDAIVLDPPTFSQSKEAGVFQAEKDFGKLVTAALPLLKPEGVLFASTNAARLEPEKFLEMVEAGVRSAGRKVLRQHYVPQPPDFPISREERGYLKTVWARVK